MPRYVILEHDHPERHWDFMLEAGTGLRTWRLFSPPTLDGIVRAESLPDHRPHYLEYEGPISGGRGSVLRWDNGSFIYLINEGNRVVVLLKGERYRGLAELNRQLDGKWFLILNEGP